MKAILTQDIKSLGKKGELVSVSDGYARNYLFPRKLASEANAQAMNELKNRDAAEKHRIETEKAKALAEKAALDGKTVKLAAKAGQSGKLFGSVTAKEIAEKIKDEFGVEVDKRKIAVEEIKRFGTYECEVKLYHSISANIFIFVGE
ncbi:MAG: 50S ribosomal protein L9 [Oscillospiraceae bacterium]|nr:50S ribosomal protein L9 [Oscillospiraceae bacterium]